MKQLSSILKLIIINLATIFFIAGLIFINVSVYHIFNTNIGLLATGITLVVVALILSYEESNLPQQRR